jgi:hypothetical protein
MEKFDIELIKNSKVGKNEIKIFNYTAKNKKDGLTIKDMKNVIKSITDKDQRNKVRIRALGDTWKTLKSFDTELMTDDEIDEYLNGRVRNTSKFHSFYQFEIGAMIFGK